MSIPLAIQALINQLNQKINETEQGATEGLKLLRLLVSRFPENVILIQYFAYLNAILFFIETARKQIQITITTISSDDVPLEIVRDAGEDLGNLLGRVIEEVRGRRILDFLEALP